MQNKRDSWLNIWFRMALVSGILGKPCSHRLMQSLEL